MNNHCLPPELDTVIRAVNRGGAAPQGCWDALSVLTGIPKHSIRGRAQHLRDRAGVRVRKPAKGKEGVDPTPAPSPAPARMPRRWWAPWLR